MPDIKSSKVYLTNEQRVLLSNLKLLIAVRNGNFTLPYLSSSEIECLITDIATIKLSHSVYYHYYCMSYVYLYFYCV